MNHDDKSPEISLDDFHQRECNKEILATTAMYGPWKPDGTFDWKSYENLVRKVLRSGSVPATNVDTTWAIYNDWELTRQLVWRTAEIALEEKQYLADDRPLLVAGLNTNQFGISIDEIVPTLKKQIHEIDAGLREINFSRIRYMPVPDRRLFYASSAEKIRIHQEMGRLIGDFTQYGLVFFELDIGIDGFGSNYQESEIAAILGGTPQIQEYKSAIITRKSHLSYPYDIAADLSRIKIVEEVAPTRVQFSTGNDWFIALSRLGKNILRHGYLLGASQMSPELFKRWREAAQSNKPEALTLEQDLQAAAKDFWTPGNVGIYRHYLAIFLAITGLIQHPLPHPKCDARYRVKAYDYFLPLKHAIRMDLIEPGEIFSIVRNYIPGCKSWSEVEIRERVKWMG